MAVPRFKLDGWPGVNKVTFGADDKPAFHEECECTHPTNNTVPCEIWVDVSSMTERTDCVSMPDGNYFEPDEISVDNGSALLHYDGSCKWSGEGEWPAGTSAEFWWNGDCTTGNKMSHGDTRVYAELERTATQWIYKSWLKWTDSGGTARQIRIFEGSCTATSNDPEDDITSTNMANDLTVSDNDGYYGGYAEAQSYFCYRPVVGGSCGTDVFMPWSLTAVISGITVSSSCKTGYQSMSYKANTFENPNGTFTLSRCNDLSPNRYRYHGRVYKVPNYDSTDCTTTHPSPYDYEYIWMVIDFYINGEPTSTYTIDIYYVVSTNSQGDIWEAEPSWTDCADDLEDEFEADSTPEDGWDGGTITITANWDR